MIEYIIDLSKTFVRESGLRYCLICKHRVRKQSKLAGKNCKHVMIEVKA